MGALVMARGNSRVVSISAVIRVCGRMTCLATTTGALMTWACTWRATRRATSSAPISASQADES